ncbi:PP2C family protein-serine/threonine phosphatase [Geodermatophilus sp. SYSU D00758]
MTAAALLDPALSPPVPGPFPGTATGRRPQALALRSAAASVARAGRADQDAGCAGGSLLAVADGVGGAAGGATASAVVIRALAGLPVGEERAHGLRRAVRTANGRLGAVEKARPELHGMATTLTALAMDPDGRAAVAHVGDSRAYLWRAGGLSRLTADQTVAQALVDAGVLPEERAAAHPLRSVLVSALHGADADLGEMVVSTVRLAPGDRLLLCTDGLSGSVHPDLLTRVLREEEQPGAAAVRLLRAALACGSRDDVTAVVAHVEERDRDVSGAPVQTVGAAAPGWG